MHTGVASGFWKPEATPISCVGKQERIHVGVSSTQSSGALSRSEVKDQFQEGGAFA